MTVTHHTHEEYTTKASYRLILSLLTLVLGSMTLLMIAAYSTASDSLYKSSDIDVKVEKHLSEFTYIKSDLDFLKQEMKTQSTLITEIHNSIDHSRTTRPSVQPSVP